MASHVHYASSAAAASARAAAAANQAVDLIEVVDLDSPAAAVSAAAAALDDEEAAVAASVASAWPMLSSAAVSYSLLNTLSYAGAMNTNVADMVSVKNNSLTY
jgi:hypothetical protein